MQIKTRIKEEITILDMEGQFDMEAQAPVEGVIKAYLTNTDDCIIWNFENISTITGAGIAILFNACSDIKKHGGLTTMVNVKPAVIDALEVHKILQAFNILANEDAAVKQLSLCREDMGHMHKRLFDRAEVDLKAVYRKFKSGRHANMYSHREARVSSLSRNGLFMQTDEEYPSGTVLELSIVLDDGENEPPLRLLAKVVRTYEDPTNNAHIPGMGLSIVNIDVDEKKRLEEFLLPFGV